MKHIFKLTAVAASAMLLSACSASMERHSTGKAIEKEKVSKIQPGVTHALDVISDFGAPEATTRVGQTDIFIYKNCEVSVGQGGVLVVGYKGSSEACDELIVGFDGTDEKVKYTRSKFAMSGETTE